MTNHSDSAFILNKTLECAIWITEINDHYQVVKTYLSLNDEDFHLFVTPWKKPYWKGLLFSFRGHQARIFYKLIQEAKVNWDFFQETKLNRIDLCYDRLFESDVSSVVSFLKDSCQQYQKQSKRYQAEVKRMSCDSYLYRIGNRRSLNFGRVYLTSDKLMRFELEFKDKEKQLRILQNLLVKDSLEDFESFLIEHFYQCWTRWVDMKSPYADWLVNGIRRIQTERSNLHSLITTSMNSSKDLSCQEEIYRLLQLLSFLRTVPSQKESLDAISYYRIEFPLEDFARFIGRKGNYHKQRLSDILTSLSYINRPVIDIFSDSLFQSYLPIPLVQCETFNNVKILKLSIQEQLYDYRYLFHFPNEFLQESGKVDRSIKLFLIQGMTNGSLRKKFYVFDFLNQFACSNQKKKEIKDRILWFIHFLVEEKFVESDIEMMDLKTEIIQQMDIKELTSLLVGKAKIIYLTEIFNPRF